MRDKVCFLGGSYDGTKTKSGVFCVQRLPVRGLFVCVETDGSLEMLGLRQGAYVVFELHTLNNGVRDPRNLRLATDDEIVAYMPRCEPSVNSVKKNGLRLTRRPRRRSSSETWFTSNKGVIFPPRIPRICPQLRTLMLEIPFGSSA